MSGKTDGQIIKELAPGQFTKLGKVIPAGTLEARKLASGAVTFYWRVTIGGKTAREVIGVYDPSAPPKSLQATDKGYSIMAAMRAAEALAAVHHANREDGGYAAIRDAEAKAKADAKAAKLAAEKCTLAALMGDYADYLEGLGRVSHSDVRSIMNVHVLEPWPTLAALPAREVTSEQVADMMRRVFEAGKGRTANKLRSYLRAAYQVAKAAKSKPSIPVAFKAYGITANPVADTEPDESQNRADKRPLSVEELRTYWQRIEGMEGLSGAILRLHLLTGGQRIAQLVRLRTADITPGAIVIYDGKGRPGRPPRQHSIPLTKAAAKALAECNPQGEFALSTDGGKTHVSPTTLSAWAVEAADDAIPNFLAKRLRSGVETLLASAKVTREGRGRLQSHGIGGVQDRHYDAHDYLEEKRAALETLYRRLTGDPGKVVKLRA